MYNRIIYKTVIPLVILLIFALIITLYFILYNIRNKFNETIEDRINLTLVELESKLNLIDSYVINQVQVGMKYLKKVAMSYGEPNIEGNIKFFQREIPNLKFGDRNITLNFDLVDNVREIVGGTATIFVKSGDEFVRITSNVQKSDDSRAIGTILDPKGKVIQKIKNAESFYGYATILENPFMTGYEPIFNKKNEVIGIFYVGYPLTALTSIKEQISSARIFNKGFVTLIDDKGIVIHCSDNYQIDELKNILQSQSFNQEYINKEISFDKWNYKLFAAVPKYEINAETFSLVKDFLISNFIIFSFIILFTIVFLKILIIKPIVYISDVTKKFIEGDKQVRVHYTTKDELGNLSYNINSMIETIENNIIELKKKEMIALENAEQSNKLKALFEEKNKLLEKNISILLNSMDKLADGQLNIFAKADGNEEQIIKLFNGFNNTVVRIRELVLSITKLVHKTSDITSLIATNSEKMASNSKELSNQIHDIASAIEEISYTITEATKNTNKTAENSQIAAETASMGDKVVNETILGIEKISEIVTRVTEDIIKLGDNSKQIGEIIQVINEIAEQTNLLALNAAIEAARAGEQGKGFAVVADEVRKLAERTTKATKQISSMIKKIQTDTEKAVVSVNAGIIGVNEGKQLANRAKESLKNIITKSNEVVDIANQVAAASQEQSLTIEQMSRNLGNISNFTNQSSIGIQQIARSVDDLNNLIINLKNIIQVFKLNDYK
jgi:methyl-accepting chemotaxis protein